MALLPYAEQERDQSKPRRKSLDTPLDKQTFVKPIKQSFVKNPRLMPMTRLMLTLISGWAGQGDPINTTIGIIAKHLSRSRRQVFRYIQDAVEEGYLYYSKTKCRRGLYTGIRIRLNFPAIRHIHRKKVASDQSLTPVNPDVTYSADTNNKYILNTKKNDELWERLLSFGETLGYMEKREKPS